MTANGVVLNKKTIKWKKSKQGSKAITPMKFGGKRGVSHIYRVWMGSARRMQVCEVNGGVGKLITPSKSVLVLSLSAITFILWLRYRKQLSNCSQKYQRCPGTKG
jgi:hypothetical protein